MNRIAIAALLGLLIGPSSLFGQNKPQLDQKVGNCSVIQNGTGNTASLTCDDIDATLAKQIREILNGTRQSASAAKEISEKLDQLINHLDQEAVPPEVGLRFVYSTDPSLMIVNQSAVVARDIKWMVVLWNRDLPDRNDPLPIPVSTFDWLKGHTEGGPQNLFDSPSVSPLLKQGNHLVGSASVTCPTCSPGRTYIVSIIWGTSGWFSEVENEKSGNVLVPSHFDKESRTKYFEAIEVNVPAEKRIPIPEEATH